MLSIFEFRELMFGAVRCRHYWSLASENELRSFEVDCLSIELEVPLTKLKRAMLLLALEGASYYAGNALVLSTSDSL